MGDEATVDGRLQQFFGAALQREVCARERTLTAREALREVVDKHPEPCRCLNEPCRCIEDTLDEVVRLARDFLDEPCAQGKVSVR